VALAELWQMLAMVEKLLLLISVLVLLAAMVGMITTLLASMKERQREMAVLRAAGAHPWYLWALIQLEVLLITLLSMVSAAALLMISLFFMQDTLAADYGLFISVNIIKLSTLFWAAAILLLATTLTAVPAWLLYRQALSDGLTIRL
jgi:putative ABC transport system permease protein